MLGSKLFDIPSYHVIVTKIHPVRLFNKPHIFIPTWLKALDKVQSEDFQYAT